MWKELWGSKPTVYYRNQVINVSNKAQLLTAFGCAIDFPGWTEIILLRKDGKTFYDLTPQFKDSFLSLEKFNKRIRRARAKIRRTPAECFR